VEETLGVARLRNVGVQIHALHGASELDWVEPKRDRGGTYHRAEDSAYDVIEGGSGSNLQPIDAR
jgi:hypothetical protein